MRSFYPQSLLLLTVLLVGYPGNNALQSVLHTCPAYTAVNTDNANQNTVTCTFNACAGLTLTITTLSPGPCDGDTILKLYDGEGSQLAFNDDIGGPCSQIVYPTVGTGCQSYELRQGCSSSATCSGTVVVTVDSASIPTAVSCCSPTTVPTSTPTDPLVCFSSSSLVVTEDNNSTLISDVKLGDKVLSYTRSTKVTIKS